MRFKILRDKKSSSQFVLKIFCRELVLVCILAVLLSNSAYARPFTDFFRGGLVSMNDFFTNQGYAPYAKAIDFFFFSLLFISVYMIGARYAFKDIKRPEKVVAVTLGLMSSFLLVLAGFSATVLLPYMNWLLYALLFMLIWWMLKLIKNNFWRFLLALLLTLLIIAFAQGLFGAFEAPDTQGFFSSLGSGFGRIDFPEISGPPGVPDYLKDLFGAPTTSNQQNQQGNIKAGTVPTPTTPQTSGGFPWSTVVIILMAIALMFGMRAGYKKWGKRESETRQVSIQASTLTLRNVIEQIFEVINSKRRIWKQIKEIIKKKEVIINDTGKHGIAREYYALLGIHKSEWIDPNNQRAKDKLNTLQVDTQELLKLEANLEKGLRQLLEKENSIIGGGSIRGKAIEWANALIKSKTNIPASLNDRVTAIEREIGQTFWINAGQIINDPAFFAGDPPWYKTSFMNAFDYLKGLAYGDLNFNGTDAGKICIKVRDLIDQLLKMIDMDIRGETSFKRLFNIEMLRKMSKERQWQRITNNQEWIKMTAAITPDAMRVKFTAEKNFYDNVLTPKIVIQIKIMTNIIRQLILTGSNQTQINAEMDELKIVYVDSNNIEQELNKTQAQDANNAISREEFVKVFTKLNQGGARATRLKELKNFKVVCYVNSKIVISEFLGPHPVQPLRPRTITNIKTVEATAANPNPSIEWGRVEIDHLLTDGKNIIIFGLVEAERPIAKKWRDIKRIEIYIKPPENSGAVSTTGGVTSPTGTPPPGAAPTPTPPKSPPNTPSGTTDSIPIGEFDDSTSDVTVLTLKPLNSTPDEEIMIFSVNHNILGNDKTRSNYLSIGNADYCNLRLLDLNNETWYFALGFNDSRRVFSIYRNMDVNSEFKIDNRKVDSNGVYLNHDCTIFFTGYEFEIRITVESLRKNETTEMPLPALRLVDEILLRTKKLATKYNSSGIQNLPQDKEREVDEFAA